MASLPSAFDLNSEKHLFLLCRTPEADRPVRYLFLDFLSKVWVNIG